MDFRARKIARVLNGLLLAALVCNLVILYLVPTAVLLGGDGLLETVQSYLGRVVSPGPGEIAAAALSGSVLIWGLCWGTFNAHQMALTLFLLFSGVNTAVILWQARRVLRTILRGTPFSLENAVSLKRAAVCCFLIAAAALARAVFSIWYFHSLLPLATYNALFVPLFAMAGLLCLVMSALFRQAAELKAENDLTI